jgi:hypothetical protein
MPLPSYSRVLCPLGTEETVDHLFLECDLARACWSLIGLTIISEPDLFRRFQSLKLQLRASSLHGLEIFKYTFRRLLWKAKKSYFLEIELWLE